MGDVNDGFAELHQGGRLARDSEGEFRAWKIDGEPVSGLYGSQSLEAAIKDHLEMTQPLGVYPIRPEDDHVKWAAVDWDTGDSDSLIHAVNVYSVLEKLEITSWIELSRSKGCHLWVYFSDWIHAKTARTAMIAACQLVDAPIVEVYPKQSASNGGWGNGLRLPYAKVRPEGRQVMIQKSKETIVPIPIKEFVSKALKNRTETEKIIDLKSRFIKPKEIKPRPNRLRKPSHHTNELHGLARHIFEEGPKPKSRNGKVVSDRSEMLFTFACDLFRQGYDSHSVEMWVAKCDQRWGGKFASRKDGAQRIRELVSAALRKHSTPTLSFSSRENN